MVRQFVGKTLDNWYNNRPRGNKGFHWDQHEEHRLFLKRVVGDFGKVVSNQNNFGNYFDLPLVVGKVVGSGNK